MTEYMDYLRSNYFEDLYELPTNGSEYALVQGELIEEVAGPDRGVNTDHRVSETDAMDVARFLNRGDIETAEETLAELLEQ